MLNLGKQKRGIRLNLNINVYQYYPKCTHKASRAAKTIIYTQQINVCLPGASNSEPWGEAMRSRCSPTYAGLQVQNLGQNNLSALILGENVFTLTLWNVYTSLLGKDETIVSSFTVSPQDASTLPSLSSPSPQTNFSRIISLAKSVIFPNLPVFQMSVKYTQKVSTMQKYTNIFSTTPQAMTVFQNYGSYEYLNFVHMLL